MHTNKNTQYLLLPIYRRIQFSTRIFLILELYVRQVHHQKFLRWCLYNANETESMLPRFFNSNHWCKVWVCANYPLCIIPWQHRLLQHVFTMRDILFIIFLLFLITCRLNNTYPHHNPQMPTCSIMYLLPILRLPFHCNIYQQTQTDPMNTLSVPLQYWLISTYDIWNREELCSILIKISNKFFNKFLPMSLMDCNLIM